MNNSRKKPIIGILGGICSGKSTVAAEFGKLGCAVIDADKIAHKVLDEPSVRERIVSLFGSEILDSAGKISRKKLAEIVFAENDKLRKLNEIVHQPVLRQVERLIESYSNAPEVKAIVLDMPLLVEVGWEKRCDKLIFVDCKEDLRLKRAGKMPFFEKNQLKVRENFQISLDKKASIAENTIDNNSDFSALAGQVAKIFSYIVNKG